MTQEAYLRLKKEYKIRRNLLIVLFTLFSILVLVLIFSSSRFLPLGAVAMGTVVPFSHFLFTPLFEKKKAIEEEHPEWKALSTSGVKVPSDESGKKIFPFIASVLALVFTFSMLYRPVKKNPKIPTIEEIKKIPRLDSNYTPKSKNSSSSEPASTTTTSDSKEDSSTEENPKTEASNTETRKYNFHIYGIDDEELDRVIDKSLKDIRENHAKKQATEDVEEKNE